MRDSFLRSLGLGVTLGAGACGIIWLLSGCATNYTEPAPPMQEFRAAAESKAELRSLFPGIPTMTLIVAPASPVFVAAQFPIAKRGTLSLAWDASPDTSVTGYRLHYGTSSGSYQFSADVGSSTNAALTGLDEGRMYYVVASAYDASGSESDFSNEASGMTDFAVTLRQQCWEVSAWGRFGVTNQMQMSTNLIDWEVIHEWVGTENPAGVLHTNRANAWFRVEAL